MASLEHRLTRAEERIGALLKWSNQVTDVVNNLLAQVQKNTQDVVAILAKINTAGISAEDKAGIEQATATLKTSDDALEAVINPPPAP